MYLIYIKAKSATFLLLLLLPGYFRYYGIINFSADIGSGLCFDLPLQGRNKKIGRVFAACQEIRDDVHIFIGFADNPDYL